MSEDPIEDASNEVNQSVMMAARIAEQWAMMGARRQDSMRRVAENEVRNAQGQVRDAQREQQLQLQEREAQARALESEQRTHDREQRRQAELMRDRARIRTVLGTPEALAAASTRALLDTWAISAARDEELDGMDKEISEARDALKDAIHKRTGVDVDQVAELVAHEQATTSEEHETGPESTETHTEPVSQAGEGVHHQVVDDPAQVDVGQRTLVTLEDYKAAGYTDEALAAMKTVYGDRPPNPATAIAAQREGGKARGWESTAQAQAGRTHAPSTASSGASL
ncbi:MAG: hypothetical protein L0J79_02715 [Propionibacterium sp.]|nr:hypothetical protein [Propionibacterium sp.]